MKKITLSFLMLISLAAGAQERVTTFGIAFKPVFPSSYFRTGPKTQTDGDVAFTLSQYAGFSAGGIIRFGLTKSISMETGLSYVKRLYNLKINDGGVEMVSSDFKVIGYEVPLQTLVFIQLSREIWMNAALGPALSIFPSDVRTGNSYFVQETRRKSQRNILKAGLIANIGWEFRTKKSGYIYAGSSYHRSFSSVYTNYSGYSSIPNATSGEAYSIIPLQGDYLSLDIRYYFHENARPKKVK